MHCPRHIIFIACPNSFFGLHRNRFPDSSCHSLPLLSTTFGDHVINFSGQSASVDSNDAMLLYKSRVLPSSPEAGLPPVSAPFIWGAEIGAVLPAIPRAPT